MALKDLHRKFKAFKVSLFLTRERDHKKLEKRSPWMTHISHGTQVVERRYFSDINSNESEPDFAVAQREQIEGSEVWFFGVFDPAIGDRVTKYLQTNLFDKDIKETQIKTKSKEAIKKAYQWIRAKLVKETTTAGCASVIVINGERIVAANMGDYRAVVCKDGVADQICESEHTRIRRRWSLNVFSGTLHMRIRAAGSSKASKQPGPSVAAEKIDSDTEFIILASNGIWQVMKNQEAVNLIRHLDDPQEAAECLAKEALTRMSKGNISCSIIRFD